MLVNDMASDVSRILFIDTLKDMLCSGTTYEFSAYMINTAIPQDCTVPRVYFPSFTFRVETTAGLLLKAYNTGPMGYDYNMSMTPKFHFIAADFILPPGVSGLVLKIEDDASSYHPCGYSFAIDDIQFAAIGPKAEIAFDGAVGTELIRSICFQDNKTVFMTGTVGNYYANTALQWEQSTDHGVTWTDIPGATGLHYSQVFSIPDTFLFRLTAAEAANIASPNCRVVSDTLKVEVNGIPTDLSVTNNSPVCAGSQLKFNASGGASYIWTGPNGFYDDIAFPQIFYSTLADSGMYYADIITRGGCRAKDSTYVKIIGTNVDAWPDTSICKGRSVRLHASPGTSYVWSPVDGLSGTSIGSPFAKPDITTVYTVKITDSNGCSDTAKVEVTVINDVAVKAGITGPDYFCRPYDSASFKNISTGNLIKWNWNFDNGQTAAISNPPDQYYGIPANKGNYIISLAVADGSGCADTAYHLVTVENNCYITVPSAFTPNSDGLNDYLCPLNAFKATNLTFMVYNRSGQLVFETKDWTRKWDGTIRGIQQSAGVYVWMLDYIDASGRRISLKGTTVLIGRESQGNILRSVHFSNLNLCIGT